MYMAESAEALARSRRKGPVAQSAGMSWPFVSDF